MTLLRYSIIVSGPNAVDKVMSFQKSQKASSSCCRFRSSDGVTFALCVQRFPDVFIAYSLNVMLTLHYCLKETTFFGGNWSKGSMFCTVTLNSLAHRVKKLTRRRCFANYCERLKITLISCARNLYAPAYVDYALPHFHPPNDLFVASLCPPSDFESLRNVYRRLNSEYVAGFVVHLYRVLSNPVSYPQSFAAPLKAASHFALEVRSLGTRQETQNILGSEFLDCISDQSRINRLKALLVLEHDVCSIFALANGPVIPSHDDSGFWVQPRIDFSSKRIQKARPLSIRQFIHQVLGSFNVINPSQTVAKLLVLDPLHSQPSAQPLTSVNANLNCQWQPSLKP